MKKIAICLLAFVITNVSFSQKKELTLNDAVREQYRMFKPESQNAITFVPNSNEYVYASDNYQTLFKVNAEGVSSEFLRLVDVNKVLGAEFSSFFGFSWLNATELLFTDGQSFYSYNVSTKTGAKIAKLTDDASNSVFQASSKKIAFTRENNLFVLNTGKEIAITNNTDKNIVSGDQIARQEFGITNGIFWSSKGNLLAFYQKDESEVKNYPLVDITGPIAIEKLIKYPMAGQGSQKPKVGIYDFNSGKTAFISPRGGSDDYLTNVCFSPDEQFILIAEVNRAQNKCDLNLYSAKSGSFIRTLITEESAKWVEPEHPAFFPSETNNNFIWISEKDGFNNLYYYSIEGKLIKQLTTNKFVTKDIVRSINKGTEIVFTATGTSPLNTLYYAVNFKGVQRLLTLEEGTHNCTFNTMGSLFIDQYSSHSVPNRIELKTSAGKLQRTLLVGKTKLSEYKYGTTEIGQLTGKDGSILYTRLIKPSNFDATKKYPVLVYVYGGPHAQMITNSWLDGANLWMHWMAEQGYLVFTLDNRGSGERGVAFETQIHRQLGNVEMEDQLTGVDYLKSLSYVDGNRLAVHGWSFGGFMTTSLMLRSPGTFNCGIAGGPVTDWKYYEIMYGERYMDTPQENEKGYEQASLFTHAKNLKGDLLLIHGTVDDVVVPQHNYALVKKFVELGIQMDFFPYPMHPHNVSGKDRVHLMTKVLNYVIENNQYKTTD